jgi:hypothetical protein
MADNPISIRVPPNSDALTADNWREVQRLAKRAIETKNKVDSPITGLAVVQGKVRVDVHDKTADYLGSKLLAGTGVTLTEGMSEGGKTLTAAIGAHADLTDMPDTAGTVTDHDTRYVVQQSDAEPTTPAPYEGMLWYDTDEPEPEIFLIGDGATGVDFQIKVDGETNDGVIIWMEDEDQFKFSDRLQTDGGIIGKITAVTDTYTILVSDETVVCNKATNFTVTLPAATVGQKFSIKNIGLGMVTVDANSTDKIDGNLTQTIYQYECVQVQCYVANNWSIL